MYWVDFVEALNRFEELVRMQERSTDKKHYGQVVREARDEIRRMVYPFFEGFETNEH